MKRCLQETVTRRKALTGFVASCSLLLFGACDAGGVTIVVLPAEYSVGRLEVVASARLTATRVIVSDTASEETTIEERTDTKVSLSELSLQDLSPAWWTFLLEAYDRNGELILQGETVPVEVVRGEDITVRIVLAPPESVVPVPLVGGHEAAGDISARRNLSATTFTNSAGATRVLVAGGSVGGGTATHEAWEYHPVRLVFEPVEQMHCFRAGHSAARLDHREHGQVVLLAGGGDVPCGGGAGRTSANSMEFYVPGRRSFEFFDPEWDFSPNLSNAQVVALGGSRFFLVADGNAWVLDLEHPSRVEVVRSTSIPGELHRAVALGEASRTAVLGVRASTSSVLVFEEPGLCGESSLDQHFDEGYSLTALPSDRLLVISGSQWWVVMTNDCRVVSNWVFRGTDPMSRDFHTATLLRDQRVLIVGGQADEREGITAFFVSESLTSSNIQFMRRGPHARHSGRGHAVSALPDGTALIVGGGIGAELFNPHRGVAEVVGAFDNEDRVRGENLSRVVLAIDTTADGEPLRQSLALAAYGMLARPLGEEFTPALGSSVGVISTDRGAYRFVAEQCASAPLQPEWYLCPYPEEYGLSDDDLQPLLPGSRGDLESLLRCRIAEVGGDAPPEERCPIRQPLGVVSAFMDQLEAGAGSLDLSYGNDPGSMLFILAVAGEDCSEDPMYRGPDIEFNPYTCDEADGLISPIELAGRVKEFTRENYRIEVIVLYGALYAEFCQLQNRLREFVDHLDDQGYAFSACDEEELAETTAIVQNTARSMAYRYACLPTGATAMAESCQVYSHWEDESGEWTVPRPYSTDWSFVVQPPECIHPESDEARDAIRMTTTCEGAPAGLFKRFFYVCW